MTNEELAKKIILEKGRRKRKKLDPLRYKASL